MQATNKPPSILTSQEMSVKTDPAIMMSRDREIIFNAYVFNYRKQRYELDRPELLSEDIIEKLTLWRL